MLKGFQIRSVLCCWYRFCLSSDHHNYKPKFIEEMLELCFLKCFFFFITTQLHFCWLAQRRCNKMHKEEMCEEALSSVCVVNKILCLFNQNQTVALHHLMPPIEQTRPASLPGKRNPPGGFAQSLHFSVCQLLWCLFLNLISWLFLLLMENLARNLLLRMPDGLLVILILRPS